VEFSDFGEPPQEIPAETGGEKKEKSTQAGTLLKLVEQSGTTFFHTDAGDPYAVIPNSGHDETWALEGRAFRVWLNGLYYKKTGNPIGGEAIKQAIETITFKAIFDNPAPITLHTRVAAKDGTFWYDLTGPDWNAIKIEPGGWTVESKPPTIFTRYGHQDAQIIPIPGGELDRIFKYIPIKEHPILFLCWLISAFIPGIPHPMPILHGEKGAAKTTTSELIKSLVDPSTLKTMTLQNDTRTLAVNLTQHWFLPFDNISFINEETSDTLCRAITGGGIQQRKLFTNGDDVVFTFQRVLCLNGINNAATRPDLLDRSILIELRRIPEEKRQELSQLQAAFERDKPDILGGIFDTLAEAMRIYPTVKLDKLPRMADFARWGYAIGEALSKGGGERFLQEYTANRATQNTEAINSDPVATLIVAFMDKCESWSGTPTELYKALETIAPDHGISTKSKAFPQDPPRLSKRITAILSNLELAGILCERGKSGHRGISLTKANLPSIPSIPSKPA
jgi:hypothetical protein